MRFFKPTPPSSGGMQSLTGTHAAGFSSRFAATFRPLLALALFLASGFLNAQETPVGKVQRIETRENVTVPVYAVWREDAVLTVVLFSGGGGGYGKIGDDGWPESGNFLIRTGKQWASHPFNILMVGRPSDGLDLSLGNGRIDAKHTADTFAILKAVKAQSKAPIWLIGTSMGTISVTAAGIEDSENLVAGVVRRHFGNSIIVGEPTAQPGDAATPRLLALAELLRVGGLEVKVTDNIQRDAWYKLWGNMTMNPVSAITGATTDKILGDELVRNFITAVMLEAKEIGARIGLPIADSPQDRHQVTLKLGGFKTSMLQDVEAGKPVELDALVGAVREMGAMCGIATPYTDALLGLSRLRAQQLGLYPV